MTSSDRRMASRTPTGRIGNASRASRSRTTVGFFNPSIKCRPTSKPSGVTRASQRPDSQGVGTGTEISHRLRLPRRRTIPPTDTETQEVYHKPPFP